MLTVESRLPFAKSWPASTAPPAVSVDQGRTNAAVKGAGVRRELCSERDLEPHAIGIPTG